MQYNIRSDVIPWQISNSISIVYRIVYVLALIISVRPLTISLASEHIPSPQLLQHRNRRHLSIGKQVPFFICRVELWQQLQMSNRRLSTSKMFPLAEGRLRRYSNRRFVA